MSVKHPTAKEFQEYNSKEKTCKMCGNSTEFCCKACSKKYSSTLNRDNTKVENVMEKNKKRYYFSPNYCQACGIRLPYELRHYNTCSVECSRRLRDKLVWEGDYF